MHRCFANSKRVTK